jgi:hypothetical protein
MELSCLPPGAMIGGKQAVLHQLVVQVLALRPRQEAPGWLRFKFTPSLHHVCTRTRIKFASCLCHVYVMFTHWQEKGLYSVYTMFCTYITLGLLIAFPRIQTDRIHQLTRFPAMLTFRRPLSGSILVRGGPKCAPKSKGWTVTEVPCKPWVIHVQTKMHGLHGERFHVSVCIQGRAQPVCNRLCQI